MYSEKYFWSPVVTVNGSVAIFLGSYVIKLLIVTPEEIENHTTVIRIYANCFSKNVGLFLTFYDFKSA